MTVQVTKYALMPFTKLVIKHKPAFALDPFFTSKETGL